jgi:hypothetical protein
LLNGQEVGEPGAQAEGYQLADGRTTVFDTGQCRNLSNGLTAAATTAADCRRRNWPFASSTPPCLGYARIHRCWATATGGLKYFNRPERFADCPADLYGFALFQNGSRRALVVVANFRPGAAVQGRIRIPQELVAAAGFTGDVSVQLLLDREGDATFPSPLSTPGGLPVTDFRSRRPTSRRTCTPSPGPNSSFAV